MKVIDNDDIEIILKGAIMLALLVAVVLVAALTAGAAWRTFEYVGGL